jgi:hypothetical protein
MHERVSLWPASAIAMTDHSPSTSRPTTLEPDRAARQRPDQIAADADGAVPMRLVRQAGRRITAVVARLGRKAATFLYQPLFVQAWFLPVWALLGVAKALIFTLSFRRLAPWLGHRSGIAPWVPVLSEAQEQRALLIGRAVRMAARYTPWDSNCFPQAVVARGLLGLYGVPYALFFGLRRDPTDPAGAKAHAWVAAGRVRVTGGLGFFEFTVVGCFASPQLAGVATV